MIKEVIMKAATIEEAVEKALIELGAERDDCQIEILETPKKKTLFGKQRDASVKVSIEVPDEVAPTSIDRVEVAKKYLRDILDAMQLNDVKLTAEEKEDGVVITFDGEGVAVLIGHHGDTLDSLQYLVALACNRAGGDYFRITLDCGNYREKREETLKALAAKIANKVKKTGRSQLLEPMNPYERRIIHAVVSEIPGVFSKSKGEEPNRRVVILSENPQRRNSNNRGGHGRRDNYRKPYVHKPERTMEDILKSDIKEKEDKAELYSKIEL